ncbi:pseudouridine synthase [Rubrivivax rivuli]|uniref:pseudouridine synthase n=1 Tax=Rubrivivax rivuli TaxID=1862385 RepID=UPI001FE14ED1|nr:pseudouridine synthase [Rubrivivax rivuli]
MAIDKPAGLLVHRTALDAHEPLNALDLLRAQLGEPLWPAHRLDKGTSGVLLFARSADAARAIGEEFRAEFSAGRVAKQYLALVRGWPADEGLVDHPLARDPERPSTGQPHLQALTRWRVLARHEWPFPDGRHASSRYALVAVWPETGRRHQIRRHFKHLAHPLVGDSTHGKGPHNRAVAAWLGTARLWLHAQRLTVAGRVIEAPPGPEWAALGAQAPGAATPARCA